MLLSSTKGLYEYELASQCWNDELELYKSIRDDTRVLDKPFHEIGSNVCAQRPSIPKNLHWSRDGSCFITIHEDFGIRLFQYDNNSELVPSGRYFVNSPIISHSIHPNFTQDNNVLVSQRGLPIKMINLSQSDETSYKLEDIDHDRLLDSTALTYKNDANYFIAGSTNTIAIFDVNRTHPLHMAKLRKCGTLSVVSESVSTDMIYTGSYIKNEIKILNRHCDGIIMKAELPHGNGITQIIESLNGRYLYTISRNAGDIPILDLRMDLQQVGTMYNYQDVTSSNKNQKMYCDNLSHSRGLIAGSNNGEIKIWQDAELGLDCHSQVLVKLGMEDNVSSVKLHPRDDNIIGLTTGSRYVEDTNYSIQVHDINKELIALN